jgi:hypothetical protein
VVAQRHLDDEKQNVVPLAAVTLTQQEWDALGKHGLAQMPGNKRRIAFGMILDPLDEADRAYMKGLLPAPVLGRPNNGGPSPNGAGYAPTSRRWWS